MKIVVQKFGGTSVSSKEKRKEAINKILKAKEHGISPVVVVSAMGRLGEPYSTDTLLSLLDENFKKYNHLQTDLMMCCGEIISSVVFSNELYNSGVSAVPLTGGQAGIITTDDFTNAELIEVNKERIMELLKQDKIPVVTGFQGVTIDGYFTTLGRGGSDTSASILGVALKAEKIEIYTDVDGIMTADPRIVSEAELITEITYSEVFQFANQGAKVIHPRAVEVAMRGGIPLVVKNTMNDTEGTIISGSVHKNSSAVITGITHIKDRVQILISAEDNSGNKYYDYILELLAKNNISIDLINVFPTKNIFTIDKSQIDNFEILMLNNNIKFESIEDCNKIALIGNGMRGVPGVMARIIRVLKESNIEVLQTADSHTTIWCLVREVDVVKAIQSLHKEFI